MRAFLQRVGRASVSVRGEKTAEIGPGLVILLGVKKGDTEGEASRLATKCLNLRIFGDRDQALNLSVRDVKGEVLVVSQFTLYANTERGRRPSFSDACPSVEALGLYNAFIGFLKDSGIRVEKGRFGEKMVVDISNDGPVTLMVDD